MTIDKTGPLPVLYHGREAGRSRGLLPDEIRPPLTPMF